MSTFHTLTVSRMHRETRDAVVLTLEVPTDLASTFAFQQGQYVTLRATIDGVDVRRAYSICAAQGATLQVGIKRVSGGVFSNHAYEHLQVGDALLVMPPQGNFGKLNSSASRRFLCIASGSGITPILSVVHTQLNANPDCHITLIYGNRATPSVMFKEQLAALKDIYTERLSLIYVMSREPQDMDIFHGRIDAKKCERLFEQWLDIEQFDEAYLCGPEEMMDAAQTVLVSLGMPRECIHTERFAASSVQTPRLARTIESTAASHCHVTLVMDGSTRHFQAKKGAESLLDAGLAAGIDMRYSCKGGVCSTCRAKVLVGEVEMDVNYALEDYEVRRGFVLTCQSYCVSDALTVNFDEET